MDNMDRVDNFVKKLNEETADHSRRVGFYSYIMSMEMGFSKEDSKINAIAAMTHDLGKKDIDQDILNHPGKLTEEQFEEIKRHPELGFQELQIHIKIDNFFTEKQKEIMLNVALCHHEKYNGKGYPQGLVGNEIPIEANMVCIVDMYDALTFSRVYKEGFSNEKAMDIIQMNQDQGMFNPKVFESFKRAFPKIQAIKEHLENSKDPLAISTMEQEIDMVLQHKGMSIEKTNQNIVEIEQDNTIELPKRRKMKR